MYTYHSGTQPGYSGPAVPGHTHETTEPKAVTSPSQKPVVPANTPDIKSWQKTPMTSSNNTMDLKEAQGGHKTLTFNPGSVVKSLFVTVRGAGGSEIGLNVTLDADRNHSTTVSVGGQVVGTLGNASETFSSDHSIEVITSDSLDEIGVMEVTH